VVAGAVVCCPNIVLAETEAAIMALTKSRRRIFGIDSISVAPAESFARMLRRLKA
jgi:hypothetical protein